MCVFHSLEGRNNDIKNERWNLQNDSRIYFFENLDKTQMFCILRKKGEKWNEYKFMFRTKSICCFFSLFNFGVCICWLLLLLWLFWMPFLYSLSMDVLRYYKLFCCVFVCVLKLNGERVPAINNKYHMVCFFRVYICACACIWNNSVVK